MKHRCIGFDFGCVETRSRVTSINKHAKRCVVVKRYKKYIDAVIENEHLKKEIERLKLLKGRERVTVQNVDVREFVKLFVASKKLQTAWKILFASQKSNGVPALIILFLSQVSRFYKISQCKQFVEVRGYFSIIRTFGQIHNVTIGDLSQALFFTFANAIEDNIERLGYDNKDLDKFKIERFQNLSDENKTSICFLRNVLMNETRRRYKNEPIQYNSIKIDISSAEDFES